MDAKNFLRTVKKCTLCTLFLLFTFTAAGAQVAIDTVDEADSDSEYSFLDDLNAAYSIKYQHSMLKGAAIGLHMQAAECGGFLELASPMPMPYFELSVKKFCAGIYPFALFKQKFPEYKLPVLFAGAGSLSFDNFLKVMTQTGFTSVKPAYTGITFPSGTFAAMGSGQKEVQYAVELSGRSWNTAFIAAPEKNKKRMQYGLQTGFRMRNITDGMDMSLEQMTAFIPDIQGTKKTGSLENYSESKQRYHTLAGIRIIIQHQNFSFETAGSGSYSVQKTASGAVRSACDLCYRYAGINAGLSYVHPFHIGWYTGKQQEGLYTFVRPYLLFRPVSLFFLYSCHSEKRLNTPVYLHEYGLLIKAAFGLAKWKSEWIYTKELHTVTAAFSLKSSAAWFEKTGLSACFHLENKKINHLILKDYAIKGYAEFTVLPYFAYGGSCSFLHKRLHSAPYQNSGKPPYKKADITYTMQIYATFKTESNRRKLAASLTLAGNIVKPYIDVILSCRVQYK